jgi:hypothetical protein
MADYPVSFPTHRAILYLVVIIAVVFAVCEIAVRALQWVQYVGFGASVREPMLEYDPKADLLVPKPGHEVKGTRLDIKINSLGFRADDFDRREPSRAVSVGALGARTTFCPEVSDNHGTWPHHLDPKLADACPGVTFEVINTAVGGYTTSENVRNLTHRLLPLDPNLAIYYERHDEITTGQLEDMRPTLAVSYLRTSVGRTR